MKKERHFPTKSLFAFVLGMRSDGRTSPATVQRDHARLTSCSFACTSVYTSGHIPSPPSLYSLATADCRRTIHSHLHWMKSSTLYYTVHPFISCRVRCLEGSNAFSCKSCRQPQWIAILYSTWRTASGIWDLYDSTSIRRPFDCLSKVNKVTVI